MPRIYTSCSDPLDFCKKHFPKTEAIAFKKYGGKEDGPDGRGDCFGYDCEHPDYSDTDYTCVVCDRPLTAADNGEG